MPIAVHAVDASGNVGVDSAEITFVNDLAIPPVPVFTEPRDDTTIVEGARHRISINGTDDLGVFKAIFLVNNIVAAEDAVPPFQYVYSAPLITANEFVTIGARVVDYADHVSNLAQITVEIVNDEPPSITLNAPMQDEIFVGGTDLQIDVDVVDDVAVRNVDILIDGVLITSEESNAINLNFPLAEVGVPQTREIRIQATDSTDQFTELIRIFQVVRNDPPVITSVEPLDATDHVRGNQIVLQAEVTDDIGVSRVEFIVAGEGRAVLQEPVMNNSNGVGYS